MAAASTGIDLFAWPAVAEARARVEAAEAERQARLRKFHIAPHGEKESRLRALQAATQAAIEAELALEKVLTEGGDV